MNIIFAIMSGVGFGGAMFFRKLGVKHLGMVSFAIEPLIEVFLACILLSLFFNVNISDINSKPQGTLFAVCGGLAMTIGLISYFLSVRHGEALVPSVVTPIIAAVVGVLLTIIFLKEPMSFVKLVGLIITLGGLFIFLKY